MTLGYDGRGNLTRSGTDIYSYTPENLLSSAPSLSQLGYDALGRLLNYRAQSETRLSYDGDNIITELSATNVILRRYVYEPGATSPFLWYEETGLTERRWLHADERGSIIAVSDGTGAALAINRYGDWGIPDPSNIGQRKQVQVRPRGRGAQDNKVGIGQGEFGLRHGWPPLREIRLMPIFHHPKPGRSVDPGRLRSTWRVVLEYHQCLGSWGSPVRICGALDDLDFARITAWFRQHGSCLCESAS